MLRLIIKSYRYLALFYAGHLNYLRQGCARSRPPTRVYLTTKQLLSYCSNTKNNYHLKKLSPSTGIAFSCIFISIHYIQILLLFPELGDIGFVDLVLTRCSYNCNLIFIFLFFNMLRRTAAYLTRLEGVW